MQDIIRQNNFISTQNNEHDEIDHMMAKIIVQDATIASAQLDGKLELSSHKDESLIVD
jgi:hypothetical protein